MAHHKSAKKRIRSDAAKNARRSSYISKVRTAVKGFQQALEKGEGETVRSTFVNAQKLLAKASTKGLVHKNTASRKTRRLAALVKKFESGELATTKPAKKKKKAVKKAGRKKKSSKK